MLNYSVKDAWYNFPEMTDYIFIFNVKSFKCAFLFDSDFLTYNNEYSFSFLVWFRKLVWLIIFANNKKNYLSQLREKLLLILIIFLSNFFIMMVNLLAQSLYQIHLILKKYSKN